ncbi:uncharacterized protein TM35_000072460 [Trypanosoma theileri]|uniref:Uncharacterized protein n=1 Tax=Trypanosoma theileri TaxID=67003 RepID=A0A1X0P1M3_9TRYP|nr:uncharacterized protein TM35_000072460 [Trypanosoma theileri]ORC90822.1 hypothetical protein TM35_000072460 [Trypanosoma theileri]
MWGVPWQHSPPNHHYGEQPQMGSGSQFYGSPPRPGSLGTPNFGPHSGFRRSPCGSFGSRRSTRQSTPGSYYANELPVDNQNVILVATRPLLKALARECRPKPPWCVGVLVPEDMTEELKLFSSFLSATPDEQACSDTAVQTATEIMRAVWPSVVLKPMSVTAAGISPLKDVTLHYYAEGSLMSNDDILSIQDKIQGLANDRGAQVEFGTDYREVTCVVLTDARTGRRLNIRFGPDASQAEISSNLFRNTLATSEEYRATLVALDALLRQNKILDDTGIKKDAINGEAIATMLVAIINSYEAEDTPNAGRLLMDFFLTYGFSANFDLVENSVTVKGMAEPTPKVHRNSQISVLDPSDETKNLTSKLEKAAHLQAVFNYCYTVLSQSLQIAERRRRAQSLLSNIIGGESYWGRVLQMYHEGIQPFLDVVNEKKYIIAQS